MCFVIRHIVQLLLIDAFCSHKIFHRHDAFVPYSLVGNLRCFLPCRSFDLLVISHNLTQFASDVGFGGICFEVADLVYVAGKMSGKDRIRDRKIT